jgi:hypothetical protein
VRKFILVASIGFALVPFPMARSENFTLLHTVVYEDWPQDHSKREMANETH